MLVLWTCGCVVPSAESWLAAMASAPATYLRSIVMGLLCAQRHGHLSTWLMRTLLVVIWVQVQLWWCQWILGALNIQIMVLAKSTTIFTSLARWLVLFCFLYSSGAYGDRDCRLIIQIKLCGLSHLTSVLKHLANWTFHCQTICRFKFLVWSESAA